MKLTHIMYQIVLFIYKTNLFKLKIQKEILRNRVLWIIMIFCYFVVKIKENIKYAAEPQYWSWAMEVEKTRQYIWTFWLSTTNGVEPREETFTRKPGAQTHGLSNQENPSKRKRSRAKHQNKGLSWKGNSLVKKPLWLSAKSWVEHRPKISINKDLGSSFEALSGGP